MNRECAEALMRIKVESSILCLMLAAAAASAQTRWELPPGVDWEPMPPADFPDGMVGPITFAETEFPDGTPIDGLVVTSLDGVPLPAPLGFEFSSMDATVGDIGPGDITFVQTPNIEGDATGTLTIDFGLQATSVTFGFALNCGPPVTDAATAQALDGQGNPVGAPVSVDGLDFGTFAENELTLSPGAGFRAVEITFAGDQICPRFAFDNLVYDGQPVPALPSVAWLVLLSLLLATVGLTLRRRRL